RKLSANSLRPDVSASARYGRCNAPALPRSIHEALWGALHMSRSFGAAANCIGDLMVAKKMEAELACVDCGQITPRRSANQKYCPNCRAERACATEHQLLKLVERRHAPVDWVEVDQQLSVLLGRCDLLFHNQAMFVRDVRDRRERARREG